MTFIPLRAPSWDHITQRVAPRRTTGLGGFFEFAGNGKFEARVFENLRAFFGVGALQANDEGHVDFNIFEGLDNALGHAVAAHDAAENVDEARL